MDFRQDNSMVTLPGWFQGALIAVATLILCSCRSSLPVAKELALPPSQDPSGPVVQASHMMALPDQAHLAKGSCEASCPVGAPCNDGVGCTTCSVRGPCDEWICDGGDYGAQVNVRRDWVIEGLEQQDTIAHYDTLDGRVLVKPSNRVCVYAPRFGAVRRVVNPAESEQRVLIDVLEEEHALALAEKNRQATTTLQNLSPVAKVGDRPPSLLRERQQPGEFEARLVIRELSDMIKPYCNLQVVKLGRVDNAEKPFLAKAIVSALTWTGDQAAQVTLSGQATSVLIGGESPGVVYQSPEGKPCIRLIKLASTGSALPGEEIEFTLRFDNVGSQKIGNVTIVDNLATRLAYVSDSAKASVEADFKTSENGRGSLILRWEIKEPVAPGEGGILQFRVKMR